MLEQDDGIVLVHYLAGNLSKTRNTHPQGKAELNPQHSGQGRQVLISPPILFSQVSSNHCHGVGLWVEAVQDPKTVHCCRHKLSRMTIRLHSQSLLAHLRICIIWICL